MSGSAAVVNSREVSSITALAQNQIALAGRHGERKLPDFVFHRDAKNEIFAALPGAEPFIFGAEKDPALSGRIAGSKYGWLKSLRAQKVDKLRNLFLKLARQVSLLLGFLWMFLNLTLGVEYQRVDIVLHPGRE